MTCCMPLLCEGRKDAGKQTSILEDEFHGFVTLLGVGLVALLVYCLAKDFRYA